jgi:hypothetical protein
MVGSASRSSFLFEHDLFGKPVSTFPDHALERISIRRNGICSTGICRRTSFFGKPASTFRGLPYDFASFTIRYVSKIAPPSRARLPSNVIAVMGAR